MDKPSSTDSAPRNRTRSIGNRIGYMLGCFGIMTLAQCAAPYTPRRDSIDDLVRSATARDLPEQTVVREVKRNDWSNLPRYGGFLYFLGEAYRRHHTEFTAEMPEKTYSGQQLSHLLSHGNNFVFPHERVNRVTFSRGRVMVEMTGQFTHELGEVVDKMYQARGSQRLIFVAELSEDGKRVNLYRQQGDLSLHSSAWTDVKTFGQAPDNLAVDAFSIGQTEEGNTVRIYSLGRRRDRGPAQPEPRIIRYEQNKDGSSPQATIYANEAPGGVIRFDPVERVNLGDPSAKEQQREREQYQRVEAGVMRHAPGRYLRLGN